MLSLELMPTQLASTPSRLASVLIVRNVCEPLITTRAGLHELVSHLVAQALADRWSVRDVVNCSFYRVSTIVAANITLYRAVGQILVALGRERRLRNVAGSSEAYAMAFRLRAWATALSIVTSGFRLPCFERFRVDVRL